METTQSYSNFKGLRERAESILQNYDAELGGIAPSEAIDLIHELQVHQVELEIQNEELRRAQGALEASRDQYLQLYNDAPVGYLTLDAGGIIRHANQTFANMVGLNKINILDKSFFPFIAPESRDVVMGRFKAFFKHPGTKSMDARLQTRDDAPLWVRIEGKTIPPVAGRDGAPRLLVSFSDISAQKASERKLRESGEFLQAVLDSLPAHIAVLNQTGDIVMVNREWREFGDENGLTLSDCCLGESYIAVSRAAEGSREENWGRKAAEGITGVISGKWSQYYLEYPCDCSEEKRWFEMRVNRLDHGGMKGAVVAHIDITERKMAEEALEYEFAVDAALSELYKPLISADSSMELIADTILRQGKFLTGSEHGYVSAIDPDTGDNCIHTFTQMDESQCDINAEHPQYCFRKKKDGLYKGLWGHTLNTREGFYTNAPQDHPAFHRLPKSHLPIRRFLSVPVMLRDELVGQIGLSNKVGDANDYTDRDLATVTRLAEFYALAIQRKRADAAIRKREEQYHTLFNGGSDAVFVYRATEDPEKNHFIEANEVACQRLGYTREDILRMTPAELKRDTFKQEHFLERILKERHLLYESEHFTRDGRRIPVEIHAHLLRLDGEPAVMAIARDITARKAWEREVREARDKLERRVEERTVELTRVNRQLRQEVEERQRAEAALRSERDRAQTYLDVAGVMFVVIDRTGNVRMINRKGCEILGYEEHEIVGRNWLAEFLPEREREKVRAYVDGLVGRSAGGSAGGRFNPFEYGENYVINKEGEEKLIAWHNAILRDAGGDIIGILSSGEDITARVAAEVELRKKHAELEEIFKAIPDAVIYADGERRITKVNPAFSDLFGYRETEILGHETGSLNGPLNIACTPSGDDCAVSPERIYQPFEIEYKAKDGTAILSETVTAPVRKDEDEVIGYLTVVRDIRKRKAMEHALEAERRRLFHLLDSLPEWIILISRDCKIRFANRYFRERFGEPNGRPCYEVIKGYCKRCSDCTFFSVLDNRLPREQELVTDTGHIYQTYFYPFEDVDGTPLVLELGIDITEKKTLETEAFRSHQLASIGELAAGVAHEINNPINGIINYAQIILDDVAGPVDPKDPVADIAGRIIKEGERVAVIVKNLLSFARDRKGEQGPNAIEPIIRDTVSLIESQLRKDGITLDVRLDANLPQVNANSQQIQQVFLNILSNARYALNQKYSGFHEEKRIEVRCETVDIGSDTLVRTRFTDYGVGIPEETMQKIYNPFFTTKPTDEGTGLGLSISHGIIKDHGGRLHYDSVVGEYTRAVVDLPVAKFPEG